MSFLLLLGPVALTEANEAISVLRASPMPLVPLLAGNVFFAICLNFASFHFINTCSVTTTSITATLKDCALFFTSSFLLARHAERVAGFNNSAGQIGYLFSFLSTIVYIRLRCDGKNSESNTRRESENGCSTDGSKGEKLSEAEPAR